MNPYPTLTFRKMTPEELAEAPPPLEGYELCVHRRDGEEGWWLFYYKTGELDHARWIDNARPV